MGYRIKSGGHCAGCYYGCNSVKYSYMITTHLPKAASIANSTPEHLQQKTHDAVQIPKRFVVGGGSFFALLRIGYFAQFASRMLNLNTQLQLFGLE